MSYEQQSVVITGASRDFGRTLAIRFAQRGADVFMSARSLKAARRVAGEIRDHGHEHVHAFACDLTDAASIRQFAGEVAERTDRVDVLVNTGARWLEGPDLLSASDDDVIDTIAAGATGTVLMVKRFLPPLVASERPDVVNMISAAGLPGHQRSDAHAAFHAAKSAQAGFAEILSKRLRPQGVRVIALYPPDLCNPDPLSSQWENTPRGSGHMLTAHSVAECVFFALGQPQDCFIKSFYFEQAPDRPREIALGGANEVSPTSA
ncbi:SDR family oxidoreductase [Streptomyces sp. NPDC004012]